MKADLRIPLGAMALAFATAANAVIVYRETPPIVYELQSYSQSTPAEPSPAPAYQAAEPLNAIHSGGATLNDTLIAENVSVALAQDSRLAGAVITVSSKDGDVSLSGSTRSPEQGAYAEEVARRVPGVRAVAGTLSATGG